MLGTPELATGLFFLEAKHQYLLITFVVCYYSNLNTKLLKTDSTTAGPFIYSGTSPVWSRGSRRFPKCHLGQLNLESASTSPMIHDWPRSFGGAGEWMGEQTDLPSIKPGRENGWLSYCTSRQVFWMIIAIYIFMHFTLLKAFLWRLCKEKLYQMQCKKLNPVGG